MLSFSFLQYNQAYKFKKKKKKKKKKRKKLLRVELAQNLTSPGLTYEFSIVAVSAKCRQIIIIY